jgi:hypothetical protein
MAETDSDMAAEFAGLDFNSSRRENREESLPEGPRQDLAAYKPHP